MPFPSSVTDAWIVPSRMLTAITRTRGMRVAADVRQRLLHDPVDRALELGVEAALGVRVAPVTGRAEIDRGRHVEPVDRLCSPGQRLQRRLEPEVVERRRPELGDQVAQTVDLVPEALQHSVHGPAQRLPVVDVTRVGELQAQRADPLDALVVDLTRPAGALALARLHAVAQAFDLDRALGGQTLRDARGERGQRLPVGLSEARRRGAGR